MSIALALLAGSMILPVALFEVRRKLRDRRDADRRWAKFLAGDGAAAFHVGSIYADPGDTASGTCGDISASADGDCGGGDA